MIPHILHGIWLGGKPLPARWQRCWDTWGEHHPDWERRLWTDENLPPVPVQEFYSTADLRQKADILRYVLLSIYGGVYVDADFECLRPIDHLLFGVDVFGACEDDNHGDVIGIGILGCAQDHETFREIVRELPASLATYSAIGDQSGPSFLSRTIREKHLAIKVFPANVFYPYTGTDAMRGIPFDSASAPEAYAVHHWASINRVAS